MDIELECLHPYEKTPNSCTLTLSDLHTDVGEKIVLNEVKNLYLTYIKQGDDSKPVMITLHDVGLNSDTCFTGFFNYPQMEDIRKRFCVYHLTLPGQETAAPDLPADYDYPSMEVMVDLVGGFVSMMGIKSFIGLGVGVGASVLTRYALYNDSHVNGLILANPLSSVAGWIEWGAQRMNNLVKGNATRDGTVVVEYLMWHYFNKILEKNPDLVAYYRNYFSKVINVPNTLKLIDAVINRSAIDVVREMDPSRRVQEKTLKTRTLLIGGTFSRCFDETVLLNSNLYPDTTEFFQVTAGNGFVLEEEPMRCSEAILLFLQGLGYLPNKRRMSLKSRSGVEI